MSKETSKTFRSACAMFLVGAAATFMSGQPSKAFAEDAKATNQSVAEIEIGSDAADVASKPKIAEVDEEIPTAQFLAQEEKKEAEQAKRLETVESTFEKALDPKNYKPGKETGTFVASDGRVYTCKFSIDHKAFDKLDREEKDFVGNFICSVEIQEKKKTDYRTGFHVTNGTMVIGDQGIATVGLNTTGKGDPEMRAMSNEFFVGVLQQVLKTLDKVYSPENPAPAPRKVHGNAHKHR